MESAMIFEAHGQGEAVIMIHGLGGTANVFGPQIGVLQRFFRCVRPDLPGSGRSPAPGPLSIDFLVDHVIAVMKNAGIETAHFVGHSMGTVICQHLAVKVPEAVRSLALIGPIHAPADAGRAALRERAARARAEGMVPIADAIVQRRYFRRYQGASP